MVEDAQVGIDEIKLRWRDQSASQENSGGRLMESSCKETKRVQGRWNVAGCSTTIIRRAGVLATQEATLERVCGLRASLVRGQKNEQGDAGCECIDSEERTRYNTHGKVNNDRENEDDDERTDEPG